MIVEDIMQADLPPECDNLTSSRLESCLPTYVGRQTQRNSFAFVFLVLWFLGGPSSS